MHVPMRIFSSTRDCFEKKIQKAIMAKIMANVQKRLKGASVEADFWYGENIGLAEKKSSK